MPRLSTNEAAQLRRDRIVSSLLAGKSPKEIAYDEGMAPTTIYRISWEEGFRNQLIRDDEWAHLLKRRGVTK
jgi:hypothetical protein